MISKRPLDHGHPIGEVVDGSTDLVEKIEEFGDSDGFVGGGLPQDVCAFALARHHQSVGDQLPDGITRGHHCDAVPGGQLGEGGQLVTGTVCAGGDGVAQIVGDAPVGRSGVGLVHLHRPTVPRELAEP